MYAYGAVMGWSEFVGMWERGCGIAGPGGWVSGWRAPVKEPMYILSV